jgi:hypothetical protein
MKKNLLVLMCAAFAAMSVNAQKTWDFTGEWTINAETVDDNLSLDGSRFNYVPATTLGPIVFANGDPIKDLEGLLITQGGASKLRLGFGTGMVYLNGGSIVVQIPAAVGDVVEITATSGNASATDRGFTATGGTLDTEKTSGEVNASGILTDGSLTGKWVYSVTEVPFSIKTAVGGMNVKIISVGSGNKVAAEAASKTEKSSVLYDLSGKQAVETAKGVLIKKSTYTDGSVSTGKVLK